MKTIFSFFLIFNVSLGFSQDVKSPLKITLNKNIFHPGDSLNFDAVVTDFSVIPKIATLHLQLVSLSNGRTWSFRYPLINGYLSAALMVDSTLSNGSYACNVSVQRGFFQINGQINNPLPKSKAKPVVNYLFMLKNKESITDVAIIDQNNRFKINNLLFQDTASIIFSVPGVRPNDLNISLQTPLDSAFTPLMTTSVFIAIDSDSSSAILQLKKDTLGYKYISNYTNSKATLEEVVVTAKAKKRLEDFKNENVSALYSTFDDIEINGIDDEELSKASDLLDYLTTKSAGLRVVFDSETGTRELTWRKKQAAIFIDEVRLDADALFGIHPADIALVKLVRPGTAVGFSSGEGGAVLIYLKSADYMSGPQNRKYKFSVIGYRALESVWK